MSWVRNWGNAAVCLFAAVSLYCGKGATPQRALETPTVAIAAPRYASCQALVDDVQQAIFAHLRFESADSVADQPECRDNPLFGFAARTMRGAQQREFWAATQTVTRDGRTRPRAAADLEPLLRQLQPAMVHGFAEDDVLSLLMWSIAEGQAGEAVRQLGYFNQALGCASASDLRVLDLALSMLLDAAGGDALALPERERCVQGVLNASLNVFDHLSHTRRSLIQRSLTRQVTAVRALLGDYPSCSLGLWLEDFATGRLVGHTDCRRRGDAGLIAGYLDLFEDPRRLGLGLCALLSVKDQDFHCLAGLVCGPGNGPAGSADRLPADRRGETAVPAPEFGLGGQGLAAQRFGLGENDARAYLCEQFGSRGTDADHALFDGRQDPERGLASCTLASRPTDALTTCTMQALAALREAEDGAQFDGYDRTTGPAAAVRDPACQTGGSGQEDDGHCHDAACAGNYYQRYKREPANQGAVRNQEQLQGDEQKKFKKMIEQGDGMFDSQGLATDLMGIATKLGNPSLMNKAKENAKNTPISVANDAQQATNNADPLQGQVIRDNVESNNSFRIVLDAKHANFGTVFHERIHVFLLSVGIPSKQHEAILENLESKSGKYLTEYYTTKRSHGSHLPLDQDPLQGCTNDFGRALVGLRECGSPNATALPRTPHGGTGPRPAGDIDPVPWQDVPTPVPAGIACVAAYGQVAFGQCRCDESSRQCDYSACDNYRIGAGSDCTRMLCPEDQPCVCQQPSPDGRQPGASRFCSAFPPSTCVAVDPAKQAHGNAFCQSANCGPERVCDPSLGTCRLESACPRGYDFNPAVGCGKLDPPGPGGPGPDPL
jgi:hypothetical protein